MSNKLNPFEDQLRKAAENHSVPYDASQWNKLAQQLDASPGGGESSLYKWGWSAVATVVVAFGVLTFIGGEKDPEQTHQTIVLNQPSEDVIPDEKVNSSSNSTKQEMETTVEPIESNTSSTETELAMVSSNESKSEVHEEAEESVPDEIKLDEVAVENLAVEEEVQPAQPLEMVIPSIEVSHSEICAGLAIQANLDSDKFEEVTWYLGDGTEIISKSINHVFLNGGDYEIKAYLGTEKVFTESVSIHVKSKPNANFTVRDNLERDMVPVKYISVNEEGAATYSWNLGDRTILKGAGISHTYRKKGTYEVSLRATNSNGCSWTTYKTIEIVKDFNLLATNSFTPNGDGLNDTWYPLALTSNYYKYQLQVYDRKGSLVFESNNPENKFDGKINGQMVTPGSVFIWKAITTDPNGVQQEFGGNVIAYP